MNEILIITLVSKDTMILRNIFLLIMTNYIYAVNTVIVTDTK